MTSTETFNIKGYDAMNEEDKMSALIGRMDACDANAADAIGDEVRAYWTACADSAAAEYDRLMDAIIVRGICA